MKMRQSRAVFCMLLFVAPLSAQVPTDHAPHFLPTLGEREFSGRVIARPHQLSHWTSQGFALDDARQRIDAALIAIEQYPLVEYIHQTDEYLLNVPAGATENTLAATLLRTGNFEYVEPDWIVFPLDCPNDSRFNSQWQHTNMQSCDGWDRHTGNPTVSVGICDTGIRTTHEDFQLHRLEGYNAVDRQWENDGGNINPVHPHGTQTTGCAAANGDNGVGIAGMGWNLSHRMMRVSNQSSGSASLSVLNHAARTSIENGDRVASVSYSGVDSATNRTTATYIKSIDGLLVWAAGNDARNLNWGNRDSDDIIVVGATDSNDQRASFSAYGNSVDLVAPGESIYTTDSGHNADYTYTSGTSFSTPFTAGLAALIWSADPALTPDEVENILKQGVDDLGTAGPDNTFGHGRINIEGSLALVGGGGGVESLAADDFESRSYSGGTGSWNAAWAPSGTTDIRWHPNAHSGLGFVRMRSHDGAIRRSANLAGAGNLRLTFWAKIGSFERSDSADVLVSEDGVNFTVVHTFTSADSDNTWHSYDINLAGFNATANFTIAFEANMNGNSDYYYIDDVDILGGGLANTPPTAVLDATPLNGEAPLDVAFDASASFDPDGTIVEYEWDFDGNGIYDESTGNVPFTGVTYLVPDGYEATVRITDDQGATATDSITITVFNGGGTTSLAFDDFETRSFSGGTGVWNAPWSPSGQIDIRWHPNAYSGLGFVRMRGSTGAMQRSVDLTGVSNARLTFWCKIGSFENADSANVLVSEDGVNFTVIHTFTPADSDNTWHPYDLDISAFNMTAQFTIAFDANMSGGSDYFYIDDVDVIGVP